MSNAQKFSIKLAIGQLGFNFKKGKPILHNGKFASELPLNVCNNKTETIDLMADEQGRSYGHLSYWFAYSNGGYAVASITWDANVGNGLANFKADMLYTEDKKRFSNHPEFTIYSENNLNADAPHLAFALDYRESHEYRRNGGIGSPYVSDAKDETVNADELQPYEPSDAILPESE
jgi:hypothetical protein